jgi:uncharacterized repeat protein (TIGR03803 family)
VVHYKVCCSEPGAIGIQLEHVGEDNAFYGTTAGGGDGASGVVYRLNAAENDYRVLHRFSAHGRDGRIPSGPLLEVGDFIYGVTELGGAQQGGTAYRLNRDGSNFRVLHAFESWSRPVGGFVLRPDGALYGVSPQGGVHAGGTIFRLTTNGVVSAWSSHYKASIALLTTDDRQRTPGECYALLRLCYGPEPSFRSMFTALVTLVTLVTGQNTYSLCPAPICRHSASFAPALEPGVCPLVSLCDASRAVL